MCAKSLYLVGKADVGRRHVSDRRHGGQSWTSSHRHHEETGETSARDDITYTNEALKQDLLRVQNAWDESQARRERDAIYVYLAAVFELVAWWVAENRALDRAHKALRLRHIFPFDHDEPFAAIIRCTADPSKVDKRTRSKWSRGLRYALAYKSYSERLDQFMKRKGGIDECAAKFARHIGRSQQSMITV